MATYTWDKPLVAEEGDSVTLGSSTLHYLAFKKGFDGVIMECDTAWRRALAPALLEVLYYDTSAGTYTSYWTEATDGGSTGHVPLDAMATGDYLYLGFAEPVRGAYIDIGSNVNANAASLDIEYSSTAVGLGATLAFTDVAGDSDGTVSTGKTMAQDGVITWTVPSAWVRTTLGTHAIPLYRKCYWIRFCPSAALSATVDVNQIIPVYKNTNYAYMMPATSYVEQLNTARNGGFIMSGTNTKIVYITWLKHG
jgi:hypothetical protein